METESEIKDERKFDYFRVDNIFVDKYAALAGIHAIGVFISLCRHADKQGKSFPSKKKIGSELAISERSVYSAVKKLESLGMVKITPSVRRDDGTFSNLIYRVIDRNQWHAIPTANGADGTESSQPSANDDTNRRHHVPNKEYSIKGDSMKEERTPAQDSKEFFEKGDNYAKTVLLLQDKGMPNHLIEQELGNFISYWTELTPNGRRHKWQMEKTFEVNRRLGTWFSRIKSFNAVQKTRGKEILNL